MMRCSSPKNPGSTAALPSRRWLRGGGAAAAAAARRRPAVGIVEERLDRGELLGREISGLVGDAQHVPPGREPMQRHVLRRQARQAFREDAVIEDDEAVADGAAGLADGLHEIELRGALAGEILDEQDAGALGHLALDLSVAAESFGFFAHIEHRQRQALGDPRGEGDAGGLAAGDGVERFVTDGALDEVGGQVHEAAPGARERDESPAIDIDRAAAAGGEGERLLRAEQHRFRLQQDAGGDLGGISHWGRRHRALVSRFARPIFRAKRGARQLGRSPASDVLRRGPTPRGTARPADQAYCFTSNSRPSRKMQVPAIRRPSPEARSRRTETRSARCSTSLATMNVSPWAVPPSRVASSPWHSLTRASSLSAAMAGPAPAASTARSRNRDKSGMLTP